MSSELPNQPVSFEDSAPSFTWQRLVKFLRKPGREQYQSIAIRLQSRFPSVPIPVPLPYGGWYLAASSDIDRTVVCGGFESAEFHFLQRCLRPGMTVLDIGAHHGLYSLAASKSVHPRGHVHSFEPSPRERRLLERNLRINLCANVSVHVNALGVTRGRATLFLVEGILDGCNSLRSPGDCTNTRAIEVDVVSLDEFTQENAISIIDFMKMDVEGAELSVLQGASRLLSSPARPLILAEISDLRTQPWGYPAREILEFLEQKGFHWFQTVGQGELLPADRTLVSYNHNLVAVPSERMSAIQPFLLAE
jgi:FkbM family methyltransferase